MELQGLVFETASALVPQALHNIMGTTIGLNAYAPAIQFYNRVFESTGGSPCGADVGAFVVVYPGGQAACSAAEYVALRAKSFVAECLLSNPSECKDEDLAQGQSTTWDHVYPSPGAGGGVRHVVLYGTLGTTSFCQLHSLVMQDVSSDDSMRYSARHAFLRQASTSAETVLPGYGIFLDIKNMEYNTANKKDDEAASSSADQAQKKKDDALAGVVDGVDIGGIYFSRLLERRPKDREELGILKEELEKAAANSGDIHGGSKM